MEYAGVPSTGRSQSLGDEVLMTRFLENYLANLVEIIDIFDRLGDIKSVVRPIDRSVAEWFNRSDEMAKFFNATPSVWKQIMSNGTPSAPERFGDKKQDRPKIT
ncbi:hypothetical protein JADG_005491 [Aureobasidium aubasidani]|nr:hypothetical protein JADG_005491 [Aureobasidium pullulans]